MNIRNYKPEDYEQVKELYQDSSLFGGQFDEERDAEDRLLSHTNADPQSILVCEVDDKTVGTVSLIENERVAWLFRFAVQKDNNEAEATKALYDKAISILKERGHKQVLIYSPVGNEPLGNRYIELGFQKGDNYTCYWKEI